MAQLTKGEILTLYFLTQSNSSLNQYLAGKRDMAGNVSGQNAPSSPASGAAKFTDYASNALRMAAAKEYDFTPLFAQDGSLVPAPQRDRFFTQFLDPQYPEGGACPSFDEEQSIVSVLRDAKIGPT